MIRAKLVWCTIMFLALSVVGSLAITNTVLALEEEPPGEEPPGECEEGVKFLVLHKEGTRAEKVLCVDCVESLPGHLSHGDSVLGICSGPID